MFLGDSAEKELYIFSNGFRLGVALLREAFWGLGAFAGLGELLVPLGTRGSSALDSDFEASRLRVSSALGIPSPASGAYAEESRWISRGSCTMGEVKKTTK
jgi:hypothetical protein